MTTPKMTLKNDNPKVEKAKKPEYPAWPGREVAEVGKNISTKKATSYSWERLNNG